MTDRITPEQFQAADGVADWRVVFGGASACFLTGSYAAGFAFLRAVGAVADEAAPRLDLDLRRSAVTVTVRSHERGALTEPDLGLARQVSQIARDQGISADPSAVQPCKLRSTRMLLPM